jgi:hypothetical protein
MDEDGRWPEPITHTTVAINLLLAALAFGIGAVVSSHVPNIVALKHDSLGHAIRYGPKPAGIFYIWPALMVLVALATMVPYFQRTLFAYTARGFGMTMVVIQVIWLLVDIGQARSLYVQFS